MSIYNSEFYKENLTKIFNAPHTLLQKEFKNIPGILDWIDQNCNQDLLSSDYPFGGLLRFKCYTILHPEEKVKCPYGRWMKYSSAHHKIQCSFDCPCMNERKVKTLEKTITDRYGVNHISKVKWVIDKRNANNLIKYGTKLTLNVPKFRQKSIDTCERKFNTYTSALDPKTREKQIVTKRNNYEKKFFHDAPIIHNNFYNYSHVIYNKCNEYVEIICPKHGSFWQVPSSHLHGRGCPQCKASHGEEKVIRILLTLGYKIYPQFRINECRYKKILPFDCALIDANENVIGLFEFQGRQHYAPVKFSRKMTDEQAENNFEQGKIRDKIKSDYCQNNNIPLLKIPYWEKRVNQLIFAFAYKYNLYKQK